MKSGSAGANPTDAQNNFCGGTPRLYAPTTRYDVTPTLTKTAKCTAAAGA